MKANIPKTISEPLTIPWWLFYEMNMSVKNRFELAGMISKYLRDLEKKGLVPMPSNRLRHFKGKIHPLFLCNLLRKKAEYYGAINVDVNVTESKDDVFGLGYCYELSYTIGGRKYTSYFFTWPK